MIRIQLPPTEVERLQSEFRATDDRKLRDRLQIVLLAHKGHRHKDIAADLCINRKSVQRWLNSYLERGLDGLRPRKAPGKTGNIPAAMADQIKAWVIAGPASCGLDRANWTYEELADHLKKAKGIQTSRSGVQRYCAKIDIRPYRPTYRYLRGDPAKQAKAKEDIADLKKSAGGRTRPAEPGRGAGGYGADAANDSGGQGAPAAGGDARLQGRAVRLRRAEPGQWRLAHDDARELAGGQPQEQGEQEQEDAAGLRRAPAARGQDVSAREVQAGGADDR